MISQHTTGPSSGSAPAAASWRAGRRNGWPTGSRLHPGLTVELVEIKTHGDRDRNSPLAAIGGTGLFTKEIQRAVLDRLGRCGRA